MTGTRLNILVVGATGSIGRHVVDVAREEGHGVRALVRDPSRGRTLLPGTELASGDLTQAKTLIAAVQGIDAVIFTHGSNGGKEANEAVDYGGVRNILAALGPCQARISLMTSIGVTERNGPYNQRTEAHDWKRRSERLVRASSLPYTIVRPGWFDYNKSDEHRLVLLQGDRKYSGTPDDGVIARRQIAEVLVHALTSVSAAGKTFELIAERGKSQNDWDALFAPLKKDGSGALDGIADEDNMPHADEPNRVKTDLEAERAPRKTTF
ncbi:SDR family oxidoreductase [Brytella acorum]|uniref:SDR family oxidoreductase n=1 Tax=Brytella acorum TaxID=2959299 RepID=UPI0025ADB841|nr:SDR family oxidoreductase [Brytella acorum]MDF3626015.1 SDR family oxidoreductase [Brytella acorum]